MGTAYQRFSGKKQQSTEDQARDNIRHAARTKIYVPPEFLCVDEAQKGRKERRAGLDRAIRLVRERRATVLLVFKLSRLYRKMHKSVKFVEEEVVEAGLRAISTTQNMDTAEGKTWRLLVALHGTMDEQLLEAIADHVRASHVTLMENGWATGALPVGYYPKEIPNAPKTRRGLPRTGPAIEPVAAELIRKHFALIAGGMDLHEGWRRWREENGPVDPRSTTGRMSYPAYRRMLERAAYIGLWAFGRKRNHWSSKKDTMEQKLQPPEEVRHFRCEELRIVDDVTFLEVQERLKKLATGPRQKRTRAGRTAPLEDRVVHLFRCDACEHRFHIAGPYGLAMRCPNPDCPSTAVVNRRQAVRACMERAGELTRNDTELVDRIIAAFADPTVTADADHTPGRVQELERLMRTAAARVRDLEELLGTGTDEDRKRRKEQLKRADRERATLEAELAKLRSGSSRGARKKPPTRQEVEAALADVTDLLADAATGKLGEDGAAGAAVLFQQLVGDAGVRVVARPRPGRKRWEVLGRFVPNLLNVFAPAIPEIGKAAATTGSNDGSSAVHRAPIEVWLRKPPLIDRIADEVRQMYDIEQINYPKISLILSQKYGHEVSTGACCCAYKRWYERHNTPMPPPRNKEGRPRRAA